MLTDKIKTTVTVLLVLFAFIIPRSADAQRWKRYRYEIGAGLGTCQVFGDIGGTASKENLFGIKDVKFDETRLALEVHVRYKISSFLSYKTNFNFGQGVGNDLNSRNDRGRSYKTTIFEVSGQMEYYFLSEDKRYRSAAIYSRRGMVNNYSSLAAYGFAGVGVNSAISSHGMAEIQPYDSYRSGMNWSPVIPFGVGAKYIIDKRSFLGAEFGYRLALFDYVEGYKQVKASRFSDAYYFFTFSYNYRLKTTRRNLPSFIDRKYRRY